MKVGDKVVRRCPFCKKDTEFQVLARNCMTDSWEVGKPSCTQPGSLTTLNLSPTTLQMRD
jgi:hypothetical protein